MKGFAKLIAGIGLLFLSSALPMHAQIDNGLDFTTSFSFYAGNTKMPAGSYTVTQTDIDASVLLIKSTDGNYSAFVDFIPTHAETPHAQSDVTFHKYGDTEYLNRLWVEGQKYGMKIDPTKAELKAAAAASPVEHSIAANKHQATIAPPEPAGANRSETSHGAL